MDNLDFLDAQPGEPEGAPVEAEQQPQAEQAEGPVRGPDGKFVSREAAQPEPVAEQPLDPEQPASEPSVQTPPPGYVPVSVVQELRAEMRALKQAPPQAPPDPYEDPEGAQAYRDQQLNDRLLTHTLNTSERFARKEHGVEKVEQAKAWALAKFQTDPLYQQRVLNDPDPYELVIQEFKRDQVFSQLQGSDLDAFLAWKAGGSQAQQPPAAIVQPPPQSSPPPRSMAAAPNAGGAKPGAQPVGPNVAFDNAFKD